VTEARAVRSCEYIALQASVSVKVLDPLFIDPHEFETEQRTQNLE
jgi:hypothetical protein